MECSHVKVSKVGEDSWVKFYLVLLSNNVYLYVGIVFKLCFHVTCGFNVFE